MNFWRPFAYICVCVFVLAKFQLAVHDWTFLKSIIFVSSSPFPLGEVLLSSRRVHQQSREDAQRASGQFPGLFAGLVRLSDLWLLPLSSSRSLILFLIALAPTLAYAKKALGTTVWTERVPLQVQPAVPPWGTSASHLDPLTQSDLLVQECLLCCLIPEQSTDIF